MTRAAPSEASAADATHQASTPASAPAPRNLIEALMRARQDWLEHLQDHYRIKATRSECGRLVSLKYNQLESPMHEALVAQCRGMVVDTATGAVLAWPYDKFWNYGEPLADAIDWSTATVQEKLDGSLMIVYFDPANGEWRVASSGHPTAGGMFDADSSRTFAQGFWDTWTQLGMRKPDDRGACYMFELCTQANRVVVRHERPRIVLHGARRASGHELSYAEVSELAAQQGWEHARTYPVTTVEEALAAAAELDALQTEGFVVVDGAGRRLKIKSPRYVALHHLKGEATPRRAIELWQSGETSELLACFPEMAGVILPVQALLEDTVALALTETERLGQRPELTQKDFAFAVKDEPWGGLAFAVRRHGVKDLESAIRLTRAMTQPSLEKLYEKMARRQTTGATADADAPEGES
jgi:RNA ligase